MEEFGIQMYHTKPLDLKAINFVKNPYEDKDIVDGLIDMGVLFWRDSEHHQGAFYINFKGVGYYTDLRLSDIGKISAVVLLNHPVDIEWLNCIHIRRCRLPIFSNNQVENGYVDAYRRKEIPKWIAANRTEEDICKFFGVTEVVSYAMAGRS